MFAFEPRLICQCAQTKNKRRTDPPRPVSCYCSRLSSIARSQASCLVWLNALLCSSGELCSAPRAEERSAKNSKKGRKSGRWSEETTKEGTSARESTRFCCHPFFYCSFIVQLFVLSREDAWIHAQAMLPFEQAWHGMAWHEKVDLVSAERNRQTHFELDQTSCLLFVVFVDVEHKDRHYYHSWLQRHTQGQLVKACREKTKQRRLERKKKL